MKPSLKPKSCKDCKKEFQPFKPMQPRCFECAREFGRKAEQRRVEKAQEASRKAYNKETKQRRDKLKTRSQHAKEVQTLANKLARLRDANEGCCSCDRGPEWGGQWHGSHYRAQGNYAAVRFHPFNINKSCSICNGHLSGNLQEYRKRLIQKIGLENVEWLESQTQPYTWEIDDLKEMKKYFSLLIKEYEL